MAAGADALVSAAETGSKTGPETGPKTGAEAGAQTGVQTGGAKRAKQGIQRGTAAAADSLTGKGANRKPRQMRAPRANAGPTDAQAERTPPRTAPSEAASETMSDTAPKIDPEIAPEINPEITAGISSAGPVKALTRIEATTDKPVGNGPEPAVPEDPVEAQDPDTARKARKEANKPKGRRAVPDVVEVAPIARPARMRRRHWTLLFSFLCLMVLPLAGTAWYLWTRAVDQYASTVGFTVRQEQGADATELITGVFGSSSGSSDTDILYEFIQSQSLVAEIDAKFDLRRLYSVPYDQDPVFALPPGASLEDLVGYWQRILRISYDEPARLLELRVLAFEPKLARDIGTEILARSQSLINDLNAQVRTDTLRYAETDLAAAQERLKAARTELIRFRTRTQLVDPETDLAGRMGVVNTLQGQLAEALIDADLLVQSTNTTDPRVVQAKRRIEVIRDRIADERANVARGEEADGTDYPTLLAEYEALVADREFAERSYLAALAALDAARADASRQSRYLATYVAPTLPETAEFPQRWTLLGLVALLLLLSWSILALIYYSVRDSR